MSNEKFVPEYLYHYTSVDKLALILKNKTIRLNSLDKMDDLQEQKSADIENIGRFFFVSSWTACTQESIPMWKMYTNPEAGVRVKLHSNPFKRHGTDAKSVETVLNMQPTEDSVSAVSTFLDLAQMMRDGYYSVDAWNGDILQKMEYTKDERKLLPKIIGEDHGKVILNWEYIGKCKNLHWSFQDEWRYIMMFLRADFTKGPEEMAHQMINSMQLLIQGLEMPPFNFFDLTIDPNYFKQMEITASPQMSPGNRILLETLVEKYNPEAKIVDSSLVGLI